MADFNGRTTYKEMIDKVYMIEHIRRSGSKYSVRDEIFKDRQFYHLYSIDIYKFSYQMFEILEKELKFIKWMLDILKFKSTIESNHQICKLSYYLFNFFAFEFF